MLTVSQNRQKSLLINCPNLAETVQPGIDAGNYRFKLAVPDSTGNPKLITNRFGEPFIRSVVYFVEDGSIIVGTEAENAALANPARAVFD